MKIGVVSSTVFAVPPPGYSGLEQLAWQHAEGLAKRGHEVTLFAPDGSRCDHSTLYTFGPPGRIDEQTAYSRYWPELLKQDCVICHDWQKWPLLLKLEGRLKAPVLCWNHAPVDGMYASMPEVEKPCFVCISEDQRQHFEALFPRPAKVVLSGIDIDHYRPLDVPRSKRFLFLARFSKIKGPHLAIDACREAKVGLDLVGDTTITNEPEYLEECKKKCDVWPMTGYGGLATTTDKEWRSDRAIKMVGNAMRGECVWWFSQAHCMLHPNKYFREPLGLAPLESQACGTPVIAWRYGALKETVLDGETGWLVNSEQELVNAVRLAAADSPLGVSPHMRSRCRDWVASKFSLTHMIDRVEELCTEARDAGGW